MTVRQNCYHCKHLGYPSSAPKKSKASGEKKIEGFFQSEKKKTGFGKIDVLGRKGHTGEEAREERHTRNQGAAGGIIKMEMQE